MSSWAEGLERARLAARLSPHETVSRLRANGFGVSAAALSAWEQGRMVVPVAALEHLAAVYGIDVGRLAPGVDVSREDVAAAGARLDEALLDFARVTAFHLRERTLSAH